MYNDEFLHIFVTSSSTPAIFFILAILLDAK